MAFAAHKLDHVYQNVRSGLSARFARQRLPSLAVPAGNSVRFFGHPRGPCYRVAHFRDRDQAERIATHLRIARKRLKNHVPRVHLDWLDQNVVVTEFVPGRVCGTLGTSRLSRCVRLLARLHNFDLSGYRHLGPMRHCFDQRLDWLVNKTRRIPLRERPAGLASWRQRYERLRRRKWQRVLIHGDPHEENFVWTSAGMPALVDWDLSMPGAPHFDLAYMLFWRANSLRAQGRRAAFLRSVEHFRAVYNRSSRRRELGLRDLLLWVGCIGLAYAGFGQQIDDQEHIDMAGWIGAAVEELADLNEIDLG